MTTGITELRQVVRNPSIPDGIYSGEWGAYRVRFTVNDVEYEADTVDGIRSMGAPCTVTVKNGCITVETC